MDAATQDALDMFAELPRRVQTALLSHLHALRSKGYVKFSEYPLPVAEYIAATGLMTVRISERGSVAFFANERTAALKPHMRQLLETYGIEF